MKITNIITYILRVPLGNERFFSSQCAFPERNSMLVKIETDEGIVGWGEGGQYGPPEPIETCIKYVLAPVLIGRNPMDKSRLWEELYAMTRDYGQKGTYIEAISAIDIALWDIVGKALGKPIYELLGGAFRDKVTAYATGCYYKNEDMSDYKTCLSRLASEAAGYISSGFKMIKMKVGLLAIESDIERVAAVRDVIGAQTILLVDSNHSYNAFNAIRMGRMLEKYDVRWFEEPVLPEDKDGYAKVRNEINIPIAGGECEFTRYGFKDLFMHGCVDIAQPDITVCGGISEVQKIQTLASSFGIWVVPHVWGSGIALAAALQFISTIPPFPHTANPIPLQNEPIIEYDQNYNPLRDDLLKEPIKLIESQISIPDGPGLGVSIDEDVLLKFCADKIV